jgi:sugar/nucleoside kinase (ribokinase family)
MKFPFEIVRGRKFDVLGFGTNSVDFLISLPSFPAYASKIELGKYQQSAGGEIASTMAGLQRLGLKTAYSGSFGNDAAGDFGFESVKNEGVDVSYSKTVAGATTQIAFILIDEATGERTVIWKRDPLLEFTAADAPIAAMAQSSVLHMTPHDTEACIALAREAHEHGTLVSVDIDNIFPGTEKLLPLVDVLICSSEFPERFLGVDEPKKAMSEIRRRFGNILVGMTLGESGSMLLCEGEFIESGGFDVPGGCKDTTGAGDAFRVGLLYGLLTGETVEAAARMANAVAALKCSEIGARTALPDKRTLTTFLKNS